MHDVTNPQSTPAATRPVFVTLPSPRMRRLTPANAEPFDVRIWVTFDLRSVVALVPSNEGTQVLLRDGDILTVMNDDREVRYIMAKKAGMAFVNYHYETEREAAHTWAQQLALQTDSDVGEPSPREEPAETPAEQLLGGRRSRRRVG